jgi:hypothetical protein
MRAARHRDLGAHIADGDAIDEIGVGQNRRALEHRAGDFGTVAGEREDDMVRRVIGAREGLGEGAAHER